MGKKPTVDDDEVQKLRKMVSQLLAQNAEMAKNIQERRYFAEYFSQMRHATVHHFSASSLSLRNLAKLIERGKKDESYWAKLRTDPVMAESVERSLYSLGQAEIALENGRRVMGEFDPAWLNLGSFDIFRTMNQITKLFDHKLKNKGIILKSKVVGQSPPQILADAKMMHVVLINLIDNAIKYSKIRGEVLWVITFCDEHYRFSISNTLHHDVSFDENEKHRNSGGTGMGLLVVKKILDAHSPDAKFSQSHTEQQSSQEKSRFECYFELPYNCSSIQSSNSGN